MLEPKRQPLRVMPAPLALWSQLPEAARRVIYAERAAVLRAVGGVW